LQRRITKPLAALALASALLLAPAAPAFAAPGGAITPGAFCAKEDLGHTARSSDGDLYICEKRGNDKARWHPVNTPPEDTTPANPGGAGPGKPDKPKEAATKQTTTVKKTAQDSDSLPVTGDNTPYQVGGGLALLALGGGLVLVARRRRATRFTA